MCAGGGYMYQISNEKFGLFVTELRKEKNLTQKIWLKNYMYQIKQLANGNVVFPKQKDIKKQPMFTCLQTKEYCY